MLKFKSAIYYLILFIVAVGAISYFVILPSYFEIQRLNSEIEAQLASLEGKKSQKEDVKKNLTNFLEIKNELSNFNLLIKGGEELTFIQKIEKLADENQINQILYIDKPQKEADRLFFSLKLTLTGNFSKILKFINELDKLSYYLITESVNITASETIASASRADFYSSESNLGNLTVEIAGKLYYQKK